MAGERADLGKAQNWRQELWASQLKGQGRRLFCTGGGDPARSHVASVTAAGQEEAHGGHSLAGGRFHLLSVKRPRAGGQTVL